MAAQTVRPRLLRILPPKPCGAISKPKFRLLPPKPLGAVSKPKFTLLPPKPCGATTKPKLRILPPKPCTTIDKPKSSIRLTLSKRKLAKPQLCQELRKRWAIETQQLHKNFMSERPKRDHQQSMDKTMRELAAIAGYHQRRELPTSTVVRTNVLLPATAALRTKRDRVIPMTWTPATLNIEALLANTPVG